MQNNLKLKISDLLNDANFWEDIIFYTRANVDTELLNDKVHDIEEYIEEKILEAIQESTILNSIGCGCCGHDIEPGSRYCSKECYIADNTEGV
jgi:hypothetical protein